MLALWHLLSLDAPTVAALWVSFVARACGITLPWRSIAAMFLAVWMLYAADRLLDGLHIGQSADLEARHHFHHRHRVGFMGCIAFAGAVLAILVPELPADALRLYKALASLLVAYFLLIHLAGERLRRLVPKEVAVGLFFSAAVFIPTAARLPTLRLSLVPVSLLFAAVCTLNCLYVYCWEHTGDMPYGHWTTRWATRHLSAISATIVVCGLTLAGFENVRHIPVPVSAHLYLVSVASTLAAVLLRVLHTLRRRFSAIHLRAAADFVLLTPVLLLPWV
jgi:hypothetical protein